MAGLQELLEEREKKRERFRQLEAQAAQNVAEKRQKMEQRSKGTVNPRITKADFEAAAQVKRPLVQKTLKRPQVKTFDPNTIKQPVNVSAMPVLAGAQRRIKTIPKVQPVVKRAGTLNPTLTKEDIQAGFGYNAGTPSWGTAVKDRAVMSLKDVGGNLANVPRAFYAKGFGAGSGMANAFADLLPDGSSADTVRKMGSQYGNASNDLQQQMIASNQASVQRAMDWEEQYKAIPDNSRWLAKAVGNSAQMAPMVAGGLAIGPAAGMGVLAGHVFGGSSAQALAEGASLDQAIQYGAADAVKEVAIEKMFNILPGMGKGMVNLDNLFAHAVKPVRIAGRTTVGALGEGVEEGVAQVATPYLQRAIYAPEAPNAMLGEVADAAGQGIVGGLLWGAGGQLVAPKTRTAAESQEADNSVQADLREQYDRVVGQQDAQADQLSAQQARAEAAQNQQSEQATSGTEQTTHVNHQQTVADVDSARLNDQAMRYINRATAKAGLKYRVVEGLSDDVPAYIEGDTIVYNAKTLDDPKMVQQATAHEVYHSLLGTDEHSRLMDMAVDYYIHSGVDGLTTEKIIAAKRDEYAAFGVELDDHAALDEIGADFMEIALADERVASRILTEQPNLAQRILHYIQQRLSDFKAMRGMSEAEKRQYAMLRQAQTLYEQGLKVRNGQGAEGARYQIMDSNGPKKQSYVKADRQVITGDDPKQWGQQVKRYINEKIRQNQDVYLMADNGDVLAITANTAGKATFRNKVRDRNGNLRDMSNEEYRAKLAAESHIDELSVISVPDSWNEDVNNKHQQRGMANQGWDYRRAYFEDSDGRYYEVTLSVSRNGEVNEVYNVGQMRQKKNTASSLGSSVREDGARTAILPNGKINNNDDVNVLNPSIAPDEPLSNSLFDSLTPEQLAKLLGEDKRYTLARQEGQKSRFEELLEQYGAMPDGEAPRTDSDHRTPRQTAPDNKVRQFGRNAMEAPNVTDDAREGIRSSLEEDIENGRFVYEPESNQRQMDRVNGELQEKGYEQCAEEFRVLFQSGRRMRAKDVVMGERLIIEACRRGDAKTAVQLIADVATIGTELGQSLQAMRLLKRMTPEGRLMTMQRMTERLNNIVDEQNGRSKEKMAAHQAKNKLDQEVEKTLDKSIEAIADEMGVVVRRVLLKQVAPKVKRQNFTELSRPEQQAVINEITAELVKRTGAQREDARVLADQVMARFMDDLRNSRVNELRRACDRPEKYRIELPEECVADILSQETPEGLDAAQERAIMALAEQMPATLADKINAWRYLAMLGNIRTHIRNILGNAVFTPVRMVKDTLSFTGEKFLPVGEERTKALHIRPEYREFAKNRYEQAKDVLSNGGKYNDMFTMIEQNKKVFTPKFLESLRKANTNALEWEDMLCKKPAYIRALAGYMQANHLTPEYLKSGTRQSASDLAKAENYAMQEALKSTYQEASALASTINEIERKGTFSRLLVGGLMPFKKTPINIAKRGVQYSPAGLLDGLLRGSYQLKTKRITPAEFIDKISSGLTGTSIAVLGYWMASMGWIVAGADGDDPEKKRAYERSLGAQNYAIVLPFGTYTIDWLAPAIMPLMVGAEAYNMRHREVEEDRSWLSQEIRSWSKVANPLLEMSMMQGLLGALQSFQSGSGQLGDMGSSVLTGYAGQFVPTLAGQFARTIDDTKRSTYAPANSPITPTAERFGRQMMAKLPGASEQLEPQVDVWGREVQQPGGSMAARAFNNMLNPGLYKPNTQTAVDDKLLALYDKTGESKVLPSGIGKAVEYGGKRYPLKASEYTAMQKQVGGRRYSDVQKLQSSVYTKELDDSQLSNVIANLYEYRANEAKAEYLRGRGVDYDNGAYWKAKEAEQAGVSMVDYFAVKQIFDGDYDKIKPKYDACKQLNLDFDTYKAVIAHIGDIKADKTPSGGYVRNSKQKKVATYLESLPMTKEQKWYFMLQEFPKMAK